MSVTEDYALAIAAPSFGTFAKFRGVARILPQIPSTRPSRAGQGEVRAHHGEIMQGLFYSCDGTLEHALVTLPCQLFCARSRYQPVRSGPLIVDPCGRIRALRAARLTLEALGYTGWGGY